MSNDIFAGYSDGYDAECRLTILKALNSESGKTLNSSMLKNTIAAFGFRKPVEYLLTQLSWLEESAQAIKLTQAGSVVIAELTQKGADHLARETQIVGIKPPSLPR